jgi:hypothetical protein
LHCPMPIVLCCMLTHDDLRALQRLYPKGIDLQWNSMSEKARANVKECVRECVCVRAEVIDCTRVSMPIHLGQTFTSSYPVFNVNMDTSLAVKFSAKLPWLDPQAWQPAAWGLLPSNPNSADTPALPLQLFGTTPVVPLPSAPAFGTTPVVPLPSAPEEPGITFMDAPTGAATALVQDAALSPGTKYEIKRAASIAENKRTLVDLGLEEDEKPPAAKKPRKPKKVEPPKQGRAARSKEPKPGPKPGPNKSTEVPPAAKSTKKPPAERGVEIDFYGSGSDSDSSDDVPLNLRVARSEVQAAVKVPSAPPEKAPPRITPPEKAPPRITPPEKAPPAPRAKVPSAPQVPHAKAVPQVPHAICVDCSYVGVYEEFDDHGCRGTFCASKAACEARLINCSLHRGKTKAAAEPEERMTVTKEAMLRSLPLLDAPNNGVLVDVKEVVVVLDRATSACGTSFLYIQAHKRKGYIREAYCKAV